MKYFLSAVILFLISSSSHAQKIGVVELDSIIQHLPDTRTAQTKLDSSVSFLQRYAQYLQDSLQGMLKEINHDGPVPAEQKLAYEDKLKFAQQRLGSFQQQAHDGLEQFRNSLYEPILKKAKAICELYGKANKYTAVIEKNNLADGILFGKIEAVDVTTSIILKISKPTVPK